MNIELENLSDSDKIELISKIWNSIKKPQLLPVPAEHKKILDERNKTKGNNQQGQDWKSFRMLLDQII